MTQTIYRPVPGYTDLYAGTDASIVLAGKGVLEQKLMDKNDPKGYLYVNVPKHKGPQRVHWLVAAAYLGPRPRSDKPRGIQVRHGDHNKQNNTPNNLCYGTPKQNTQDSIDNGTHGSVTHASKGQCDNGHVYSPDNTYEVPNSPGWRQCRTCRKDAQHARNTRNLDGKPSIAEKRAAVASLLHAEPTLSSYAIAKRLNVSAPMVRRLRKGDPLCP